MFLALFITIRILAAINAGIPTPWYNHGKQPCFQFHSPLSKPKRTGRPTNRRFNLPTIKPIAAAVPRVAHNLQLHFLRRGQNTIHITNSCHVPTWQCCKNIPQWLHATEGNRITIWGSLWPIPCSFLYSSCKVSNSTFRHADAARHTASCSKACITLWRKSGDRERTFCAPIRGIRAANGAYFPFLWLLTCSKRQIIPLITSSECGIGADPEHTASHDPWHQQWHESGRESHRNGHEGFEAVRDEDKQQLILL